MVITKEVIISDLKDLLEHINLKETEEKSIKEVKPLITVEEGVDPIQKRRDEKRWKKSMGYFLLNPEKFSFKIKDLC